MAGIGALNHNVEVNNGGGGSFTLLDEDDYELEITESDVKASSTGKGKNLSGKVQVVSGPHKDRWFFFSINNIEHESAQSQAIGQGQLKALCHAVGFDFTALADSEQLHFRPFWARVIQDSYTARSGAKAGQTVTNNKIGKFLWEGMPEDDKAAPPAAKHAPTVAAAKPAEPEKPAATGRRPWEK